MKSISCHGRIGFTVFLFLFFVVSRYGYAQSDFASAKKPDPEYDRLFPYYVEVCAVSRLRPLNGPEGGGWGHALMYLNGACRDDKSPYPRIRMCEAGEVDPRSSEAGVGISVDKMFKNINWVAVPGKQLFYEGDLSAGERLTQDHFDATVRKAVGLGIFRGIEFHNEFYASKLPNQSQEEFIAQKTIGTDYAIKFGRTSLCARLPVTKEMTHQMVDYLNTRNDEVFSGKTDFLWSAYHDNCAHTVHNALAAAGIWESKEINQFKIKQFFNRSIPANEFADFAFLGKSHFGALLKIIPAHEPNDLFGTDFKLFVLEGPWRKPITRKVRNMFADPRHTDLETNLLFFKNRYESILQKQRGRWWRLFHSKRSETADSVYRGLIKKELEDIRQKLQKLDIKTGF